MDVTVAFQPPAEYLTLNKMPNTQWQAKAHRGAKNLWREAAYFAAAEAFPGKGPSGRSLPPCDVFFSFPVWGIRTRDTGNWTPTTKPILDGFVDAGVWPDDGPEWVNEHPVTFLVLSDRREWLRSSVVVRLKSQ